MERKSIDEILNNVYDTSYVSIKKAMHIYAVQYAKEESQIERKKFLNGELVVRWKKQWNEYRLFIVPNNKSVHDILICSGSLECVKEYSKALTF